MDTLDFLYTPLSSSNQHVDKLLQSIYDAYKQACFEFNVINQSWWSLPDSIIYYMAKNPSSSQCYQKMIQCCKYFFIKNPIIVVKDLIYFGNKEWRTSYGKILINIANIKSKIWITEFLSSNPLNVTNCVSSIIRRIYRCDAKELQLYNQIITFKEFVFLASNVEDIDFDDVTVGYDEDGSIVAFEKLVEAMSGVKRIRSTSDTWNITSKTFKELLKLPHFSKLENLVLNNIPQDFDLFAFYAYMNKNKITSLYFLFDDFISDEYKTQLEEIIDEILTTKTHSYKPPFLHFSGLDEDKTDKLFLLFEKNLNKRF